MAGALSPVQSLVIGVIEGLTEFLPVSSTAHMDVFPQLLGWKDPGAAYSAVIQLGPLLAIILYFRKEVIRYLQGIFRNLNPLKINPEDTDAKMGWYTIFATIPILIIGKALEHQIEGSFRTLRVVAIALIVFSAVLFFADRYSKKERDMEHMNLAECLFIGFMQVLALVPGVSRSGATMTAAFLRNYDRSSAARFSFLVSIPTIGAAGIYKLLKVIRTPEFGDMIGAYVIGTVAATLSAYLVIHWFLGFLRKHNMNIFILYRLVLGVVILALLQTGKIQNEEPKEPKPAQSVALVAKR